ncbi:hypothetical protein [Methylobacterium nonmethylotrophicum]|uniref:Uncharacterized protein n=1 Tax=Methylobacterium nonmethylotrophicum TaxID=1141884 RepID=A0A4Z0NY79_9HYPH|nr:hypothetical protein [Methylobacterium nonmethylotrophicum]TGE02436.1 hypothetical protein EU555_01305 [Methylobacterium nonmethylotrophicum]
MIMTALDTLNRMMIGPQSPGSHDRLTVFLEWADAYARESSDFWIGFHQTWSDCDDTWSQRDELLEMVRLHGKWLEERPCDFLQEDGDRAFYASLPDRITIYRGCDMDRVMSLAWTTDKAIALGFAKGHRGISVPNPVLASAFVRKHSILGAYQERQEHEILVDPSRHLTNIRVRFV